MKANHQLTKYILRTALIPLIFPSFIICTILILYDSFAARPEQMPEQIFTGASYFNNGIFILFIAMEFMSNVLLVRGASRIYFLSLLICGFLARMPGKIDFVSGDYDWLAALFLLWLFRLGGQIRVSPFERERNDVAKP